MYNVITSTWRHWFHPLERSTFMADRGYYQSLSERRGLFKSPFR
jgi:hypothetical protein